MADKVVSVRVAAKVDGFVAGMRKAKASVDDLTKAAAPTKADAFEKLANKAALAGVAVAAGIGVAIKRFADFDKAMSAVQANSGATGTELAALRQAALDLGAASQFSAKEAAEGINELSKAGVESADILGGGLKGSLDLAAAGQIGVAEAAETAATAMTQFNLDGSKVPHIADLLTNAANKAQGGVGDMGMALKQAGLVASQMGLSIEETTAGLTAFASAGLIGSDAGTSFKSMLQRLANPSNEAASTMADLGINAYDAQGQFVGLAGIAGQLKASMQDLTPAQRDAAMATIFGSDAVRAAAVLYNEGAEGIRKWTDEVSEQGAAAKQAAILTDNLAGDLERLGGAVDSALIATGSGANDALRTLTQGLTGLVDHVSKIPGPILLAGGALTSLALLAPKGILAWRRYSAQLDSLGLSFDKLSAKAPRTARGLQMVGKAAGLLGVAATAVYAFESATDKLNADKLGADLVDTADGLGLINKELAAQTSNGWGRVSSDIDSFGKVLGATFDPGVINNIDNAIGGFKSIFGAENVSNIANAAKQLQGIDQAMASLVSSGNAEQAEATFAQMTAVAEAQGISVEQLQQKLPLYAAALANAGNQAATTAGDTGLMTSETDSLKGAADKAKEALDALQEAILGLGSPVAEQRQATRDYESAIDGAADSLEQQRDELVQQRIELGFGEAAAKKWADQQLKNKDRLDLNTEAGRRNQAALDAIRDATLKKVTSDYRATESTKGTEAATKKATESMKAGRTAFINAATAAGMTKDEARALADQLGLIPDNVSIAVKQSGAEGAGAAIDQAARDRNATIWVQRKEVSGNRRVSDTSSTYTGVGGRAAGGAIYGPGTGTSDTAGLYRLSNGEHVLTAREVQKLGGQSAVYAMRSAIREGWAPGLAGGGAVQYAPRGTFTPAPSTTRTIREGDSVTLNAYGNDSVQATRAALREWELRQVARL